MECGYKAGAYDGSYLGNIGVGEGVCKKGQTQCEMMSGQRILLDALGCMLVCARRIIAEQSSEGKIRGKIRRKDPRERSDLEDSLGCN